MPLILYEQLLVASANWWTWWIDELEIDELDELMNKLRCDILSANNLAAAFWINCKGLIELAGRPESIAIVQPGQNKSLNKELRSMFRKKGPDLLDVE